MPLILVFGYCRCGDTVNEEYCSNFMFKRADGLGAKDCRVIDIGSRKPKKIKLLWRSW